MVSVYRGRKGGISATTYGMSDLGFDEIEILDSKEALGTVVEMLTNISIYVIEDEIVLRDGETVGLTETQKLAITRSKGFAVEGESLKIQF